MKKVALILPPTVQRLHPHAGAQNALFELSEKGILPRPRVIIGVSAGAMAGLTYLPWTVKNFRVVNQIYRNLKPKDVSSFPWPLEGLGATVTITALLPLVNLLFNGQGERQNRTRKRFFLSSAETAISLASAATLAYLFWKRESIFDNDRLRQLLLHRLDFEGVFNSDIILELLATDLKTGREVIFTNYRPEDQNPKRIVEAALASASIVGYLPSSKIDSGLQSDGGVLSHIPWHRAIHHGVDVIVVLAYFRPEILPVERGPFPWNKTILRASEISEAEITRLTLENFELQKRAGEKLPELFILTTEEPLPNLNFRNFNEADNIRAMEIGYQAVYDNLDELKRICC